MKSDEKSTKSGNIDVLNVGIFYDGLKVPHLKIPNIFFDPERSSKGHKKAFVNAFEPVCLDGNLEDNTQTRLLLWKLLVSIISVLTLVVKISINLIFNFRRDILNV